MKKLFNIAILLLFFVSTKLAFGEMIEVTGDLTDVTVYRGQASVTRSINTKLPAGTSELIVRGLPNRILAESLYAQTDGDITVLSVRYRERAVERDTRAEVKELDTQIEAVKRQIYHTDRQKNHLNSQWAMFIKLRDFTVEAKNFDLNRGLLTFEPIDKLTRYIQAKGQEFIDKDIAYDDELAEFNKQLELLQRKRADLDAGRSKTEREAVVFVNKTGSGTGTIKLSYIVDGANWFAQYNLRANPEKSAVLIEYNAVVNQTSGEDWEGVSLSLSTSEPTMVAAPPILDPMLLTLRPVSLPAVQQFGKIPERQIASEQASRSQTEDVQFRDISDMFSSNLRKQRVASRKGISGNFEINAIALDNQFIELSADKDAIQEIQQEAERFARTEGVSVSYNLPGKLTLPSRTDQQIVNIASINAKSEFTMVAMPLLTNYIYRQADILNDSDKILLPGQASMYLNGDFVGKGDVKLVTIGEKFTTGFGIDSQIQISREFKDKKSDTLWGSRVESYEYRIAVDNYSRNPVKLRLMDRIPYAKDTPIEIQDFVTNIILSKDAEYLRALRPKGILRWDLNLKPDTTKENATIVTYSYTMKYDKDMQIKTVRSVQ